MPVVRGYSMGLYCDCRMCNQPRGSFSTTKVTGFAGENFRDCLKQAKQAGWVFKERNTVCFAPGHGVIKYDLC